MPRTIQTMLFVAVLLSIGVPAQAKYRRAGKPLPGRYIVMLKAGTPADQIDGLAKALAHQHKGRVIATMKHAMLGFGAYMPEAQARALARHPLVELVEEDEVVELSDTPLQSFDFATLHGQAPEKTGNPFLLESLANNCAWQPGGYYACFYGDDTYWHLDRLDNQGQIYGTKAYAYNTTGYGVRAYVIDTGVYGTHSEFDGRVETGANMTVDPDIADAPLPGEEPAVGLDYSPANFPCNQWQTDPNATAGHGTGVASVLGGTTIGVAKKVTIVPVKVLTCAGDRAKLSIARGLDWVLVDMQGRSNRALVTMSTFVDTQLNGNGGDLCEDGRGGLTNCVSAIEHVVNKVIGANIPVIVSANNRSDGECRTSPARMGYGNEAAHPSTYRTITVGGTMYVRNGTTYSDQRWTCAASPEGCDTRGWVSQTTGYGRGSNFGPCVSIWAPAWNMYVAGASGPNSFRTRYNPATGTGSAGPSSGTSWSAPYTAGVVARLLERSPWLTPQQIWTQLVNRANQRYCCLVPDLDPSAVTNTRLVYMSPFE